MGVSAQWVGGYRPFELVDGVVWLRAIGGAGRGG
jgi:hypothetical protein